MALTAITNGQLSDASQLNQVIYALQRLAGQQEQGQYVLAGWNTGGGQAISYYYASISRGTTPSGVTVDHAVQLTTSLNAPGTTFLSSSGVQVFCLSTATASSTSTCGGNITMQY